MLSRIIAAYAIALVVANSAISLNIVVDYRYDTNGFFLSSQRRIALEAAAKRYSDIITTSLTAETLTNSSQAPRIGFTHPGNGLDWQVSPATSTSNDALFGVTNPPDAAEEYRGPWSIAQDEWILYAGARPLTNADGQGGTGTGLNFTSVFTDESSHLNRGFRTVSGFGDLPVWGGSISFDTSQDWHFGLNAAASDNELDFYSVALHEIGHALGLSTSWNDWEDNQSGNVFQGANAVNAYNAANGTSLTGLNTVDNHWQDGVYQAPVFAAGNPNLAGTIGQGSPQDLLMEPVANFTDTVRRFELTTVDVGALQDVGWTVIDNVIPEPTTISILACCALFASLSRSTERSGT